MKHNILLWMTVCLLGTSCSNILDKEPDFVSPDYYYNTESELLQALNGVYNRLIDTNGRMYSKGLFSLFVLSDESFYTNNFNNTNIRAGVMDAADLDVGRFWEVLYEGVNRANLLLYSVEGKELDTDMMKAAKGEALFLRGYYYYLLTSFFGEVPLKLAPTMSANDNYLAKSPLTDIYKQIVKDMQEAEKLVLDIDALGYNERISKTGVQAILARVFLKMAGEPLKDETRYADALEYANKVIASTKHELNPDYKQIFINHSQDINESKECIWEIGMYGNKIGTVDLAGSVGVENGILCRDESIGYSGGPMKASKRLYDSYGEGDLRKDWNVAPYYYNVVEETKVNEETQEVEVVQVTKKVMFSATQIYNRNPGKWRREYEIGQKARLFNSTNFPVVRYSDVLLMKAEAENEVNGPTDEAYDAINQVRRRAYGKPIHTVDATVDLPADLAKTDFLEEVKKERFRELCFEGMRKLDLLRWGEYVATMKAFGTEISTTAPSEFKYASRVGQNLTDRNVLFPIPNTEITVNKLMTQNEGW